MRGRRFFGVPILAVGLLCVTGCMSVQTSSGGTEQRTQSSEQTAASLRSDWGRRLQDASPKEAAMLLAAQIDAITSRYVAYSRSVADKWREGNDGRGTPIPDSEMRNFVNGWISTEKPILSANDDMVEYAYSRIKESRALDEQTEDVIRQSISAYYELYSAVFIPNGSVEDYEYAVGQKRSLVEDRLRELDQDLARYQ
ncbi:hypothetical protein KQH82_01440 [bacterium]|nr:hypothetical protein [bacterium]